MSDVYQLIYASEAKLSDDASSLNFEISRILIHSKRHNSKHNINGVLYCANGYFFQVLEGEKHAVLTLFEHIKSDTRHFNVRVLREGIVSHAQFQQWSMHLVSDTQNMRRMMKDYNLKSFVPYQLDDQILDQLTMLLSHDGEYGKPMYETPAVIKPGLLSSFKKRLNTSRVA